MYKIIKYILTDILRNKIIIAYIIVLLSISLSIFALEDNVNKGLLSLLNLILIVLPLFSIIFSTIYLYNSSEFIELILSQPIKRKTIWIGFSFGLSIALSIAFILSIALPILIFVHTLSAFMIVIVGLFLTNIFVAVALFACVKIRDKARGIGVAIILWMYFSLLFDALILFLLFQFNDYPIEKPMIVISSFNPIDLARVLVLLQLDESAMMGYTGAIFKEYFGTKLGMSISVFILTTWYTIPLYFSNRQFDKKDL